MSSDVSVFDWKDPTGKDAAATILQPVLLATRRSCNGAGNWYPQAGDHHYRFSLTSHAGDWRNGRAAGIAANHPLIAVLAKSTAGTLPAQMSFASVSAGNIMISTLKKGEDDQSVVARLYDIEGRDAQATLKLVKPIQAAAHTDLLEENPRPLPVVAGAVAVPVGHHAIETLKITP